MNIGFNKLKIQPGRLILHFVWQSQLLVSQYCFWLCVVHTFVS